MKVLILNLIPNTIGDTLFLTPLINVLKSNGHDVHITVSPLNKMLLENNKDISKLYVIHELEELSKEIGKLRKGFAYFTMIIKIVNSCIKEKYDACLVAQPNFFVSQAIPFLIGAKRKIGYLYKGAKLSFLLTDKVYFEEDEIKKSRRHYVDSVLDLARPLGIKPKKKDRVVTLSVDHETEKNILSKFNYLTRKYVCFQPGAKWLRKQWPKEHFKRLGEKLIEKNFKIIILGSKNEHMLGEHIKNNNVNIINLCGKINLLEVICIMKNSKINICNDSGLAHISSAISTKTAVIYGIAHPRHSEPLGSGKVIKIMNIKKIPLRILREDETEIGINLMKNISVEKVFNKIKYEML